MTTAYPFQLEDLDKIDDFEGRALVAHEPGLGKTAISLWWAKSNRSLRPIVVVCPASIKEHWAREAATHINMPAEILSSTRVPKRGWKTSKPLYIINYEILGPWLKFLLELKPKLLVFDEAHYLINPSAQRTKNAKKLSTVSPHALALTGTPITSRPAELWSILNVVRPEIFPSKWEYLWRYAGPKHNFFGWEFKGATNLDELHDILIHGVMIRRRKADVLTQLPKQSTHVVVLPITNAREYQRAKVDLIGWLREQGKSIRGAKRAPALAKLQHFKHLAAEGKLKAVQEWIDNFLEDTDEKLILFFTSTDILEHFHDLYKGISVMVNGSVPSNDRQRLVDQFTNNKATRLFIGNLIAAGTGWNGTAATTTAFVELGWRPGDHTQAAARMDRIGQQYANNVYYLLAKGTVEERIAQLLQDKQEILDVVIDGKQGVSNFSIADQLIEELLQEGRIPPISKPVVSRIPRSKGMGRGKSRLGSRSKK